MKLNIQSLHFATNEPLKLLIAEKLGKLDRYYNRIDSADITLKFDKSDVNDNKVCEIRLGIPGNDLFALKQADTFEKAVSETVEALRQQIMKLKD